MPSFITMRSAVAMFVISSIAAADTTVGDWSMRSFWDLPALNSSDDMAAKLPSKNYSTVAKPKLSLLETGLARRRSDEPDDSSDESTDPVGGTQPLPDASHQKKKEEAASPPTSSFLASRSGPPSTKSGSQKSLEAVSDAVKGVEESASSNTPQSREMTTAAMEAAVMELMSGKSAFGATPMGGSVQKIVDILTKTMMPKVIDAHKADQNNLIKLDQELGGCTSTKDKSLAAARPWNVKYKQESVSHKRCRADEAVRSTTKTSCLAEQRAKFQVKVLKCQAFAAVSRTYGSTFNNRQVVTKTASEAVGTYILRISNTICGDHVHGEKGENKAIGGWGGGLQKGMYDKYLRAKDACAVATKEYNDKVRECKIKIHRYNVKKAKCNGFQVEMDARSCKHAILLKDTCEQYAGCFMSKQKAFSIVRDKAKMEERDRKAEWRGLKRISCLIAAFADGGVSDKEIDACKKATVTTNHLSIRYPKAREQAKCENTKLYPATGAYKRAEFASLPNLAKGRASVPCSGVEEIPTKPQAGSPKSCRCSRVTLEGHYHAGPLVKCTACHDVRRSRDKSSCPRGTKLFAPSTKSDWKTFLASTGPLRNPSWIIDITRPQNGCGGCTSNAMNSKNKNQASWKTSDGAPWWLRSTAYTQPSGDYSANCFMDLGKKKPSNENQVTFNDHSCNYHSTSYYCQKFKLYLTPKAGSPNSCKCTQVVLASGYSAGTLVKCEQCLTVYRSTQKNSCPAGMKIFSPRSRADWKTVIASAQPLRAPNWIIDVTRPQNGCGGCKRYPMNSKVPQQATWRTSDGSAWWLRSSRYTEPSGDYKANCFMDLGSLPTSDNTVKFNDANCKYHSRSYYCQPKMKKKVQKKNKAPAPPPARRVYPLSTLKSGLKEEVFYFKQGKGVPSFRGKSSNVLRRVNNVNYRNTQSAWKGFTQKDNFAVRWTGVVMIKRGGNYKFYVSSDDGSNLYIDDKRTVRNDGLHAYRSRFGTVKGVDVGQHKLRLEYFESGGSAGCLLRWRGPGTGGTKPIPRSALKFQEQHGFKEEIYFLGAKERGNLTKVPNLNGRSADVQRIVGSVNNPSTKSRWNGYTQTENFAVRWSGDLTIGQKGNYKFSLKSDDGSKMMLRDTFTVNNDGLHSMRPQEGTTSLRNGVFRVIVEYFQKGGHAGMVFRYMGPQTGSEMVVVPGKFTKVIYDSVRTPPLRKKVRRARRGKARGRRPVRRSRRAPRRQRRQRRFR